MRGREKERVEGGRKREERERKKGIEKGMVLGQQFIRERGKTELLSFALL